MEENSRTGDLHQLWGSLRAVLRRNWWISACAALLAAVGALGFSLLQTPMYGAIATLYVTSGADADAQSAYQGALASEQRIASYARLVRSETIVSAALAESGLNLSPEDAKTFISASAAPDTVLLDVAAVTDDPIVSASLANAIASAMSNYVDTLETPSGGGDPLAKLTVVTPATPSDEQVSPNTTKNVALGLIVGGIIGFVISLVRFRLDGRIRTEASLQEAAGSPVLAVVPAVRELGPAGVVDFSSGGSAIAEAYRRLRTNLTFASVDRPVRTVLVTSAGPGDGKSTTALNLAAALAEAGNHVVLVDADLRRPTIHKKLLISGEVGLSNALRGDAAVAEVLQPSGLAGLDVLASGNLPPNPAELLGSHRAEVLFDELSKTHEYVVIDSPPVVAVTDAAVVSRLADGVLIVGRSGVTYAQSVRAAVRELDAAQARVVGSVLNFATLDSSSYQYAYYGSIDDAAIAGRAASRES